MSLAIQFVNDFQARVQTSFFSKCKFIPLQDLCTDRCLAHDTPGKWGSD